MGNELIDVRNKCYVCPGKNDGILVVREMLGSDRFSISEVEMTGFPSKWDVRHEWKMIRMTSESLV